MAPRLHSLLLRCLFTLVIGIILYISWSDILDNIGLRTLPHSDAQLWSSIITEEPTESPDLTPIPVVQWKDFKHMPHWDFDDEYKRDKKPSKSTQNCDSSLWNTINQDPEMRKKFIANIRMYVHNGSITMTEWNRLSHFNKPYGFMTYSHEDVVPAINLIHKLKEALLPPKPGRDCVSCAVVGNGGVLWRSKKGREIDNHDYVIRVNAAVIKGFEEDVGNRTDIYVHTAHSISACERVYKKYGYKHAPADKGIKYVLIPEAMRDFEWLTGLFKMEKITKGHFKGKHPWHQYSGNFNESRFYVLHMDFLRYIRNRFLMAPNINGTNWINYRPTNGAFMLFLGLQLCDKVDAYGFITENYKKYSNYYFQRGAKTTRYGFWRSHNYSVEMNLWKKLHDLKIINLYQGDPRQTETTPSPQTNATAKSKGSKRTR